MHGWIVDPAGGGIVFGNCDVCQKYGPVDKYGCCKSCAKTEEDLIAVAREFIRRHSKVQITDLAEALGIDPARVFKWLQQGRLRTTAARQICTDCGQPILNGLFCGCTRYVETITPNGADAKSHGTPRRVQAKWEEYWFTKSRIHRHRHRRIWLST